MRSENTATATPARKVGRAQRKKIETRARLMATAYEPMGQAGVDSTSIAEIAEHADLGFGTFYNYFKTKDDIAINVLDAVIEDLGRRNDLATRRSAALRILDRHPAEAILLSGCQVTYSNLRAEDAVQKFAWPGSAYF